LFTATPFRPDNAATPIGHQLAAEHTASLIFQATFVIVIPFGMALMSAAFHRDDVCSWFRVAPVVSDMPRRLAPYPCKRMNGESSFAFRWIPSQTFLAAGGVSTFVHVIA
jgi:hypothetical protein